MIHLSLLSLILSFQKVTLYDDKPVGYFLSGELLIRKWTPPHGSAADDWSVVRQIVVPQRYCEEIFKLAHENPLAGHLGVNKTYDRILRSFFLAGIKERCVKTL